MRLIRGAPGSGKTAFVFREFGDAVRQGRTSLRIVVPTATLVRHYQHELARSGLVFDPGLVVSLSRFAQELTPESLLVPASLVRAVVRASLTRLALPEFAEVASTSGMADVVLETITLFENADCAPEQLSRVRGMSGYGKVFVRLWKEVNTAIAARGFVTRGQMMGRARSAVAAGKKFSHVWMDGFLNFSPIERSLIRALDGTCDVTVTLTESPMTDGSMKDDARRFAMELGATDNLLVGPARHPSAISVLAPSPEREADEIARRILGLHDDGVEFADIAVAVRDVDAWLPLLRAAFDRFGIPARYYFSTPVRRHPVAVFLGGLVSCALNGWEFASTVTALRAHPAWGHSADFDRFDFTVCDAMPGRGAKALLSHCESDWLRLKIADCLKIEAWRNERARPAVWKRKLQEFAASVYRPHTIPPPEDYAAVEIARSHAAAMRAWSDALDTAVHFFASSVGTVALEDFHAVVRDELDAAGMQVSDDRRNAIHVMSSFEARQWEVRTLFVCGMSARDYPRRHTRNLLFSEAEIAQLRGQGIPVRSSADDDRDEEMLFDLLKTRALESLILTAAARDSAGRTMECSRYFAESPMNGGPVPEPFQACRPAFRETAVAAGVAGHIGETSLAALAERHRTVGLTALENLTKCRFLFFADRTLTLKGVPERPGERLHARLRGQIFHQAMEEWLADRSRDFVDLFKLTFEEACRKRNIPIGYALEVERVETSRIAREVNASAHWPVVSSEMEVDCSLDFPGGVTVKCRVDRIDDLGEGNCVIVDYKSGKVANVDKLVDSETSLQGPLYALAVREKKGLKPVAMVFLAIREGKAIGWGAIPGSSLELEPMAADWIDKARDRTIARLQSFLAGDIHAEPAIPENCQWCDFKMTCRIEQESDGVDLVKIGVAGGS